MSQYFFAPWSILGAGSLGLLWAGYLQRAGRPVKLLLKHPDRQEALQRQGGLKLEGADGEQTVPVDTMAIADLQENLSHVLVLVKAYDVLPALRSVHHCLHGETVVVLLQNGMGVYEAVRDEFPWLKIVMGTTTHGAYQKQRFHVVHAGQGKTWLGQMQPASLSTMQRTQLLQDLALPHWPIIWDDQIETRLWTKLAMNCSINALTALLECKNGQLDSPFGNLWIDHICEEVAVVAQQEGHSWESPSLPEQVAAVLQQTAENYSSMYQDFQRAVRSEIDYINGYLVQLASKYGLSCPYNQMLWELIRCKEELHHYQRGS